MKQLNKTNTQSYLSSFHVAKSNISSQQLKYHLIETTETIVSIKSDYDYVKQTVEDKQTKRENQKPSKPIPLYIRLMNYKSRKKSTQITQITQTILDAQHNTNTEFISNGRVFLITYDIYYDNNKYSRSYHNKYGAVRVISNRRLDLVTYDKFYNKHYETIKTFDAFKGNYLIDAVASYLNINKVSSKCKKISLNSFFNPIQIHKIGATTIYKNMFGSDVINYVITYDNITYHNNNKHELIAGLKHKMINLINNNNQIIDNQLCSTLGFCEYGVQQFKYDVGIHDCNEIKKNDLQKIINNQPNIWKQYEYELKKLGIKKPI
jgi:hypothetical protein